MVRNVAKKSKSTTPIVPLGPWSPRQFNQHLHTTGRYEEFNERAKELRSANGITLNEARQLLAPEFGAPMGVLPRGMAREFADNDGTYLDTLEWVSKALGRSCEGKPPLRQDAPGPTAWGMFNWAKTDTRTQKEFYAMWTAANKRRDDEATAAATEVERTDEEIGKMLTELSAIAVAPPPESSDDVFQDGANLDDATNSDEQESGPDGGDA